MVSEEDHGNKEWPVEIHINLTLLCSALDNKLHFFRIFHSEATRVFIIKLGTDRTGVLGTSM